MLIYVDDVLDAADVLKRGSVDWEGQTLTMKKPNPLGK